MSVSLEISAFVDVELVQANMGPAIIVSLTKSIALLNKPANFSLTNYVNSINH